MNASWVSGLSPLVITAHAGLALALAEADVLDWLEDLGLDVTLGEQAHLLAFEANGREALIAEVDFYPLDGGSATQVRWRFHAHSEEGLRVDHLADQICAWLQAASAWCLDGLVSPTSSAGSDLE